MEPTRDTVLLSIRYLHIPDNLNRRCCTNEYQTMIPVNYTAWQTYRDKEGNKVILSKDIDGLINQLTITGDYVLKTYEVTCNYGVALDMQITHMHYFNCDREEYVPGKARKVVDGYVFVEEPPTSVLTMRFDGDNNLGYTNVPTVSLPGQPGQETIVAVGYDGLHYVTQDYRW